MEERQEYTVPATIFEVAERSGVSITTVSHVFSGRRPVSEDTRRKVLAVARELDYHARPAARALATGRTMTLGIQLPMTGPEVVFNPYFSQLLPAMSEAAVRARYAFALIPPHPSVDAFVEPLVFGHGIDGAVLIDPRPDDAFIEALVAARLPYVSLGRSPDLPPGPLVDQDFDLAMSAVLAHLEEEGFTSPALLTIPEPLSSLDDLRRAFAARRPRPRVILARDYSDDAATEAALGALSDEDAPDAFVCLTERQVVGVYRAASELGLRIPEDVGVVSFGDSPLARHFDPPVTAVCVFPDRTGSQLVALIAAVLEGKTVPGLTLMPTELLVRGSTERQG